MTPKWIEDPSPVWDKIKQYLVDDSGELETVGMFLGIFDKETMAGALLLRPWSNYCVEVHGGVSPEYWGQGVEVCSVARDTVFNSKSFLKIVAPIPEFNQRMRKCVQACGMKHEGVLSKAFLKSYRLHDLYLYGITKGDWRCLQQQ